MLRYRRKNAVDSNDPTVGERGRAKRSFRSWDIKSRWPKGRHEGLSAKGKILVAEASPWIAIVDDDPAVLRALSRLLRSRAFQVKTYDSAKEFLAALPDGLPACLIVDFQMPDMNGLELQQHLVDSRMTVPTILITAHGDPAILSRPPGDTVLARLRKPLHDDALFSAIEKAIRDQGDVG
ncbi:response regulator transcription factor [Bradyrhizobium cosmicum]|uniref:response regulator transcription factor n=1 Tax=Bradyrhizobium cosmicum TaxID=1404864 RepID=UPI0028E2743E|nr:response regulator [Bradyrhizobium cosmicum]